MAMDHSPVKRMLVLLLFLFLLPWNGMAEGTKQIRPDSTRLADLWILDGSGNYSCFANINCNPDQKLYVHIAHPGEKVLMGFRSGVSPLMFSIRLNGTLICTRTIPMLFNNDGYIQYHSQAVAGPKPLNPNGYQPSAFIPAVAGDYSIDFMGTGFGIDLFDITVIDTTVTPLKPIDGRLWSKDWGFNTYNCANISGQFLATQYIYSSNDSIVTSVTYNRMQGWNFDVTATRNGCYPPPFPWDSSCRSRQGNHHFPQYKIFINDPDSIEYPTGTVGLILGDSVSVHRSCDGTFSFTFVVNKPGNIQMNIESDLSPGIQPVDLTINNTVSTGLNTMVWNGLNALGDPVTCGDSVAISINYINGLTNIALYDVERHYQGFIVNQIRPPGLSIATYWNDTLLANDGGMTQLGGCYPVLPDTGCHTWHGGVGYGLGSGNTVNTWWYAASSSLDLGRFRVECIPHTPADITGPLTLCKSGYATYTVYPNPLPGSEPTGYEWVMTDVATGTVVFDSVDTRPSLTLHFSDYPPGQKRLKVRGRNSQCGTGLFGPGQDGILINISPSPVITNTLDTYSLCSGDTTNILLQSSMAGSSFSYTVSASSPFVTGQSAGNENPIRQVLFNEGNTIDSVLYHVVPFLNPCPGDTVTFVVRVFPEDSLVFDITPSENPVCEGEMVTFFAPVLLSGSSVSFQWKVNGAETGENKPEWSYYPANGDTIQCVVSSPDLCVPGQTAISSLLVMNVVTKVAVDVSILSTPNPVCLGDSVTLTAVPLYPGDDPVFHWKINGLDPGTQESAYTYVPSNQDEVICKMKSGYFCVLDSLADDTIRIQVVGPVSFVDTTLCYNQPYYAGGAWQLSEGTYYDTLETPVSCVRFIETILHYKPEIPVDLGADTTICDGDINLNAFVQGGTYLWQNGSSDPDFLVTEPGLYWVEVLENGCMKSDTVYIGECPAKLWIPNAFSPNGDGVNDMFHPGETGVEKYVIRVFNRWGQLLSEFNELSAGWDGKVKGQPAPEDTYIYVATFENLGGQSFQQKGTVTLTR